MVQPDPPTEPTTAPPASRRFSVRRGVLSAVAAVAVLGLVTGLVELRADQQPAASPASVGLAADAGQYAAAQPAMAMPNSSSHGAATSHAGKSESVAIQNYAFVPASLTVQVGDTVTWTNQDSAPHTVTVSDGPEKFASPNLQKGDTYSHTFTKAGTYQYYCAVHPDMKASVTAQGTPPPSTTPAPPSTSSSTPAPPTSTSPSPGSDCEAKASLQAIWMHLQSAHLEESPGQQVQDALNLDQWVKTHTVWLEHVIGPEVEGGPNTVEGVLTPLIMHLQSAHLQEGLGQQVTDLLNTDQWVKTHTVLIGQMLAPALAQTTC